jgi:hypothetical protein
MLKKAIEFLGNRFAADIEQLDPEELALHDALLGDSPKVNRDEDLRRLSSSSM